MRKWNRNIVALVAALGLAITIVLLLTVDPAGAKNRIIKLGVAGPHSGELASYGIPSVHAAQLVVKDVNTRNSEMGGILGKKVELVVIDDVCDPNIATNVATKLVSQGVPLVLGHVCSGATKAALGIYKAAGVVVMSPSATNPPLTQSGEYPNFFRTIASDDAQAQRQVSFILNALKLTKIAILHDKGDYGKGLAEFARSFFKADPRQKSSPKTTKTPHHFNNTPAVHRLARWS